MAVDATLPVGSADPVITELVDVASVLMADHALGWPHGDQKVAIIGPMRLMTIKAILAHGWMLPHKWPPLLLMAAVASLVDGCPGQHAPDVRTMNIVAAGAVNPAFPHRMAVSLVHLRPDIGVALITESCFAGLGKERPVAALLHHGVAESAIDRGPPVQAALPVKARTVLVALQTNRLILLVGHNKSGVRRFHMTAARPMTGFTI